MFKGYIAVRVSTTVRSRQDSSVFIHVKPQCNSKQGVYNIQWSYLCLSVFTTFKGYIVHNSAVTVYDATSVVISVINHKDYLYSNYSFNYCNVSSVKQ